MEILDAVGVPSSCKCLEWWCLSSVYPCPAH